MAEQATENEEQKNPTLSELNTPKEDSQDCSCPTSGTDTGVDGPTTKPTYIVPPIGTVGTFTFEAPFNKKMFDKQEYEVKAIRSLSEMNDSEEKPFENIYQEYGLTEKDFKTDLDHNVPIIVLANSSNQYYYVPASKLKSMPKVTGIKYQQVMMAINLGYLPLSFNVDLAKTTIIADVKAALGITSTVETIKTSSIQLITEDEHNNFTKLLSSNKTQRNSYRIQYEQLLVKYNALSKRLKMLNNCLRNHIEAGKPITKPDEETEEESPPVVPDTDTDSGTVDGGTEDTGQQEQTEQNSQSDFTGTTDQGTTQGQQDQVDDVPSI